MLPVAGIARRAWSPGATAVAGLGMIAPAVPRLVHVVFTDPPRATADCAFGAHDNIVTRNARQFADPI